MYACIEYKLQLCSKNYSSFKKIYRKNTPLTCQINPHEKPIYKEEKKKAQKNYITKLIQLKKNVRIVNFLLKQYNFRAGVIESILLNKSIPTNSFFIINSGAIHILNLMAQDSLREKSCRAPSIFQREERKKQHQLARDSTINLP